MIEVFCTIKHTPSEGKFGDCIRACIASILEVPTADVDHFAHDGAGEVGVLNQRLRDFLRPLGYAPWWSHFDGSVSRDTVLEVIGADMPECHYVLFGRLADGTPHAVVCCGAQVAHNPSWAPMPITQCSTLGTWTVLVVARI